MGDEMSFKRLLSSVFLGVCFSQALALLQGNLQESFIRIDDAPTHYHPEVRLRGWPRFSTQHLSNWFVTRLTAKGIELPTGLAKGSMEETAVSFAMHKLSVGSDQVVHRAGFASDITEYVYLSQVHVSYPSLAMTW
jgi:hypothetical protein